MPLTVEDKDIVKKSLIHYIERIVKNLSEELPEIKKIHLMKEYTIIGKARNEMESIAHSYALNNDEYNRVIWAALNYYIEDLKDSKEKIRKYNVKVPLDAIEKALILARTAREKIPNCNKP